MSVTIPPRPDLPIDGGVHPERAPAQGEPGAATWSPLAALGMYLLATFTSVYVAAAVALALSGGTADVAANVASALSTAALVALWLRVRHPGWLTAIGLGSAIPMVRRLRDAAWGFVAGLILYPAIAFGAAIVLSLVLRAVTGQEVEAPQQVPADLPAVGIALTVVYAVVIAPVAEEFFFRGVLFSSMSVRWGFWPAALASGFLFGLIHYVPDAWQNSVLLMAAMVPTGVALAWFRRRRGSLYASIGAHVAFNVVGLVFIYVIG